MESTLKFQRGDIYFVRLDNRTGSEQSGTRPAVILQNDVGNSCSPTLIVATLTSKTEKKATQPTHCLVEPEGLEPSIVQAEQIFTIDKSRVKRFVGHLTSEEMGRVDDAVKISLALNPMGSIQKLKPIVRSTAAYAPPEVVDGKPPVYPYTPIKSDFEDGQHTIEARILRNGGRALPILCKVYTGMTMQQEALLFAEQNGHSAPLSAGIKLRAKVAGDDAPSKEFLAATNRVGLAFNYDSLQLSDYRISCVGTALKLYNEMGEKIYCESLRLTVAAWDGKPDSFRASVLRGMMHFVELYHGEFSEERLVRALGSVHPMEIYRVGRDNPAKLPGWKKYVFPIYMAYNGKGRKDALPMKF